MKSIKYQREIPAVIGKDADGNEVITSYAHLRTEECRFTDADKDMRIAEVLKVAYNGEYTIEDDGQPEPEPEPTQLDRVEAQATYTAMMTDTLLEV